MVAQFGIDAYWLDCFSCCCASILNTMKVLELNQYYLTLCTIVVFFWGFLHVLVFCSTMHIYHNPNVINAMNACVALFAGVLGSGGCIGIVANGKSIKLLIDELHCIVDDGKLINIIWYFFNISYRICICFLFLFFIPVVSLNWFQKQ